MGSGVYTLSRNPMYLGFLMLLLGWGVYVSNALALPFVPVVLIYMNRFQIEPEERALRSRFGRRLLLTPPACDGGSEDPARVVCGATFLVSA